MYNDLSRRGEERRIYATSETRALQWILIGGRREDKNKKVKGSVHAWRLIASLHSHTYLLPL
jgi:hypothetical protein